MNRLLTAVVRPGTRSAAWRACGFVRVSSLRQGQALAPRSAAFATAMRSLGWPKTPRVRWFSASSPRSQQSSSGNQSESGSGDKRKEEPPPEEEPFFESHGAKEEPWSEAEQKARAERIAAQDRARGAATGKTTATQSRRVEKWIFGIAAGCVALAYWIVEYSPRVVPHFNRFFPEEREKMEETMEAFRKVGRGEFEFIDPLEPFDDLYAALAQAGIEVAMAIMLQDPTTISALGNEFNVDESEARLHVENDDTLFVDFTVKGPKGRAVVCFDLDPDYTDHLMYEFHGFNVETTGGLNYYIPLPKDMREFNGRKIMTVYRAQDLADEEVAKRSGRYPASEFDYIPYLPYYDDELDKPGKTAIPGVDF